MSSARAHFFFVTKSDDSDNKKRSSTFAELRIFDVKDKAERTGQNFWIFKRRAQLHTSAKDNFTVQTLSKPFLAAISRKNKKLKNTEFLSLSD